MSSLSIQCLSSPSKRDSLDEGYDPDETLKIVVDNDRKRVDILRDSDEDDFFPEEIAEAGHDDNDDVVTQSQQDFDRWTFMKDPAVLAKDTAHIAGKIAGKSLETQPYLQSPEPKEVRFVDMDTTGSRGRADVREPEEMAEYPPDEMEQDSLELMGEVMGQQGAQRRTSEDRLSMEIERAISRRPEPKSAEDLSTEELKRQIEMHTSASTASDREVYMELMKRFQNQSSSESVSTREKKFESASTEDLKRKIERLASSSLDSDQAVYFELMKKLQSQSSGEMDSDTLVYKELVQRDISSRAQNVSDILPETKKSSRARHPSMKQPSVSLQRMGHVAGSSVESNGYYAESSAPIEQIEEEQGAGARYYRHGDLTYTFLISISC